VRIKIFMDRRAVTVEEQVNHWFTNDAGTARIVKTEALLAAGDKAGPAIAIIIWYEP